jgi:endonuclease/exonuclease/phosphatase family metal-dependent hydrolase
VSRDSTVRIATYNVHKCRGMDRRVRPDRIAGILRELNADVIALQEVIGADDSGGHESPPERNQSRYIADRLDGYCCYFGKNRRIRGAPYGNAILSRLPVRFTRNYDLSSGIRERRGCLRADVEVGDSSLHIFNVHLGTGFIERRRQARLLLSDSILRRVDLQGPSVVVGDFNEWTKGLATRLMATHYDSIDMRLFGSGTRTYPGMFPVFHLDHFYFDRRLQLKDFQLCRSRACLVASDHLPMVADFRLPG